MTEPTTTDVTPLLADGTAAGNWALDPAGSRAEFRVKHFWGVITVHLEPDAHRIDDRTRHRDGAICPRMSTSRPRRTDACS